jgi:hypothetical protein
MLSMKATRALLLTITLLSLLVGCGLPTPARIDPPAEPGATLQAQAQAPTQAPTLAPSPSLAPTQAPALPTATSRPTLRPADLAGAVLRLEDFPKGFQALDAQSQAQLNLTPEALGRAFEGTFRQAKPVLSFGYFNPNAKSFEVVVGVVFYPLAAAEVDTFDRMLVDPNGAMRNFAQGFGGQVQSLESLPQVGNAVAGWGFTNTTGSATLKGEMVISRRATTVSLLLALYIADQKPAVVLAALAPLLDMRLKAIFDTK